MASRSACQFGLVGLVVDAPVFLAFRDIAFRGALVGDRFLLNSALGATSMADDNIERIPIRNLHQEDGADDLASSPDMPASHDAYLRAPRVRKSREDCDRRTEDR